MSYNYVGRKVYYDIYTGTAIVITGDAEGDGISATTREQDFVTYRELAERVPETVGMIQLEYGAYAEDYAAGGRITRIDLETLKPLFTYPDPTNPETPQEPQQPLTDQVTALKTENEALKNRVSDVEMTITEILFS
ncbi:hypothetical protein [Paenibacillus lautus]|uniref:hypothetical protein n=1 Tax=Paenibacillus lautus TaxID=1401 RepID=UPI003D2D7051